MENGKQEWLQTLCGLYVITILVVLPLYTGGSYYLLGDTKYLLFRNSSLVCQGLWLTISAVNCFRNKHRIAFSNMDFAMLAYGSAVVICAVFSSYKEAALMGYRDWYMGALSQLLFVGIYFMISRWTGRVALPLILGEAAFLAVTLIGLANRLGFDVLGLYAPYEETSWERSHMLSTIGNINWLCGYYSVMLALPVIGFLYAGKRFKCGALCGVSVCGLVLLCVQGSDSGCVLAAVCMGTALWISRKNGQRFERAVLLGVGTGAALVLMDRLVALRKVQELLPSDGVSRAVLMWKGWPLVCLAGLVVWLLHKSLPAQGKQWLRRLTLLCLLLAGTGAGLFALFAALAQPFAQLGSGRGALWELAWQGFRKAGIGQKIIGAGPDCFAEYLADIGLTTSISTEGHWAGVVYANAHNEWLNQLVNLGVLGTGCYFCIFAIGLRRYRDIPLGKLVLILYLVHSMVSFQQVLNAPMLFLVLGLCEAKYRSSKENAGSMSY